MRDFGIYCNKKSDWDRLCNKSYELDKELSVKQIKDVLVEPLVINNHPEGGLSKFFSGGICSFEGSFIAGLERKFNNPYCNKSLMSSYTPNIKSNELKKIKKAVFGGVIFNHFGHMITETLSRLWYVSDLRYKYMLEIPIVFLHEGGGIYHLIFGTL